MQANAAKKMKKAIKDLENAEARADGTFSIGGDDLNQGNPFGDGSTPTINGSTDPEVAAAVDESDDTSDLPGSLGDPFNTNINPGPVANAPPAGGFTDQAPKGGGGAGGAIGGGASAGAPPQTAAASEDPQSRYMAERNRASNRYETGGIGRGLAGGGGGVGGSGGPIGPDLSALMEKFMGQKAEDAAAGRGILDFGAGGAGAGQQPYSLLDRSANIFDRIHQTYQDKSRRGVVGL
jgi:hypothetical protein